MRQNFRTELEDAKEMEKTRSLSQAGGKEKKDSVQRRAETAHRVLCKARKELGISFKSQ